jgi:oligosaccharyltransferase complex subunit gamma
MQVDEIVGTDFWALLKSPNFCLEWEITSLSPLCVCVYVVAFSEAYDEFTILANSWRYSQQYSSDVFFVKVDIDEDGMDAFQNVKLVH